MNESEFRVQQLALLQAQVDATNANTAALRALSTPPSDRKPGDELIPLQVLRKGGPPKDCRKLAGSITLLDSGKGGTGDVIAADVPCDLSVVYDAKSPTGRIFETEFPIEAAVAFYTAEWDKAHPAFVREAEADAGQQARLVVERTKFVRQAIWWRCRMPVMRLLVGKDLDKVKHLVRLDAAALAAAPEAKPIAAE